MFLINRHTLTSESSKVLKAIATTSREVLKTGKYQVIIKMWFSGLGILFIWILFRIWRNTLHSTTKSLYVSVDISELWKSIFGLRMHKHLDFCAISISSDEYTLAWTLDLRDVLLLITQLKSVKWSKLIKLQISLSITLIPSIYNTHCRTKPQQSNQSQNTAASSTFPPCFHNPVQYSQEEIPGVQQMWWHTCKWVRERLVDGGLA